MPRSFYDIGMSVTRAERLFMDSLRQADSPTNIRWNARSIPDERAFAVYATTDQGREYGLKVLLPEDRDPTEREIWELAQAAVADLKRQIEEEVMPP